MTTQMLTAADVAEALQLPVHRVRLMIRRGEIPGRKLGARRVRIPADEFDAWLRALPTAGT